MRTALELRLDVFKDTSSEITKHHLYHCQTVTLACHDLPLFDAWLSKLLETFASVYESAPCYRTES